MCISGCDALLIVKFCTFRNLLFSGNNNTKGMWKSNMCICVVVHTYMYTLLNLRKVIKKYHINVIVLFAKINYEICRHSETWFTMTCDIRKPRNEEQFSRGFLFRLLLNPSPAKNAEMSLENNGASTNVKVWVVFLQWKFRTIWRKIADDMRWRFYFSDSTIY